MHVLTLEDIDSKMGELEALAPQHSYKDYNTVRNRANRTAIPRDTLERQLKLTMRLKLQEHDREAAAKEIDQQWLALRAQRHQILISSKRARRADSPIDTRPTSRRRVEQEAEEQGDLCSICHVALADAPACEFPCGHALHTGCYTDLQSNSYDHRCPSCRVCLPCSVQQQECDACPACHYHEGHSPDCQAPNSPDSQSSLTDQVGRL